MNKTYLVIIGFIIIIVILIMRFARPQTSNSLKSNGSIKQEELVKKPNDKVVVVKNINVEYLKKAIQQFLDLNKGGPVVKPKVTIFDDMFVITFPYDIEFETLCYFINYLEYAHELSLKPDYEPEVYGWCKTKEGDQWVTKEIVNKEVFLFIPESDDEYDNVYLTTKDNLGFKMGFAIGYSHEKLQRPVTRYIDCPIQLSELENRKSFDF